MAKKIPAGYAELSLYIPAPLKREFKSLVAQEEKTMSQVAIELIEQWVEKAKNKPPR